jgi:hypothetical protein
VVAAVVTAAVAAVVGGAGSGRRLPNAQMCRIRESPADEAGLFLIRELLQTFSRPRRRDLRTPSHAQGRNGDSHPSRQNRPG